MTAECGDGRHCSGHSTCDFGECTLNAPLVGAAAIQRLDGHRFRRALLDVLCLRRRGAVVGQREVAAGQHTGIHTRTDVAVLRDFFGVRFVFDPAYEIGGRTYRPPLCVLSPGARVGRTVQCQIVVDEVCAVACAGECDRVTRDHSVQVLANVEIQLDSPHPGDLWFNGGLAAHVNLILVPDLFVEPFFMVIREVIVARRVTHFSFHGNRKPIVLARVPTQHLVTQRVRGDSDRALAVDRAVVDQRVGIQIDGLLGADGALEGGQRCGVGQRA